MAESLRKKVEEHLSCSICLEHFRDPKVLPCLHTFCQQCIAKLDMTGNILICPECRATTKIPSPPDVSFLPSNFFAKNLLATLAQTNDCGDVRKAMEQTSAKGATGPTPKPPTNPGCKQTSTKDDAKKAMKSTSTQGATGPTPKPPTNPGCKQTSTKDDAKKAMKPKSTQGATGPTPKPPTNAASKQITTKDNTRPKSTAVANTCPPPKPIKSLFPRGSFVGDHIFRHGYHTWSVEIDHSHCYGCQSTTFEIGVISHVDGSTVAFHGYIKPGCCEEFDMELDMFDDELTVEPSFLDEAVHFDVYSSRLSPYLKINCKTCKIAVTEASFHWHFKGH